VTLSAQPELFGTLEAAERCSEGPEALFREVPSFPPFGDITNGEMFSLSLSNKAAALTHGLHRFPAKYIPGYQRG